MKTCVVVLITIAFLLLPLFPQQEPAPSPTFKASVDAVNILCTVRNRRGNYIRDLEREDFEVYEEGKRQQIDFFSLEMGESARPLTIALLIDTSGSVKDKLYFEQQAATEFVRQVLRTNKDMAAILQFDSEVNLLQDFTFDFSALESAIYSIKAGGATKLYDAVWVTVQELLQDQVGRNVMVVISDGDDTQSTMTDDEAIRVAQDQDVVIYGVGVRSDNFSSNFGKLKNFSNSTGGLFINSKLDLDEIRDAFAKINGEIKNQYSLAYVSTNAQRDGKFRKIEVKVRGSGLKVTHRRGYYAPHPSS
ncbi:MAG: VWA domain-containing protein [Acidobacteriota bacterium]